MTHTPGPWTMERWEDGEVDVGTTSMALFTVRECDEQEANARLIAAAPELLAAIRAGLAAFGPRTPLRTSVERARRDEDERRALDTMRAALAAAKGGS